MDLGRYDREVRAIRRDVAVVRWSLVAAIALCLVVAGIAGLVQLNRHNREVAVNRWLRERGLPPVDPDRR